MIGAAILETRQVVPNYSIDLALQAPMEIIFPLAPAEGLLLVDVGIGRTRENVEVSYTFWLMSDHSP